MTLSFLLSRSEPEAVSFESRTTRSPLLLSPAASPSGSPRPSTIRGMNGKVSNLRATFNKGAKVLQDAMEAFEKEIIQQVKECEDSWLKLQQEFDQRERALQRREQAVNSPAKPTKAPFLSSKADSPPTLSNSLKTLSSVRVSEPSTSRLSDLNLGKQLSKLQPSPLIVSQSPRRSPSPTSEILSPPQRAPSPRRADVPATAPLRDPSPPRRSEPQKAPSPPRKPAESPRRSLFDFAAGLFTDNKKQPESTRTDRAEDVPKQKKSADIRKHRKSRTLLSRRAKREKGINWRLANPSKWIFPETQCEGDYSYNTEPVMEKVQKPISAGLKDLRANPDLYDGILYQSNMLEWPADQQKYTLVKRTGSGFDMHAVRGGRWTYVGAKYQSLPDNVAIERDAYTDMMHYQGYRLPHAHIMPGRGHGCADQPGLALIDLAHPRDVRQGAVGDCWLLSAISAVAEHEGIIAHLFRKTPRVSSRPLDTFNQYTVTLHDLSGPEWKPVDVVVDERLCSKANDSGILGSIPSRTGELWVCYLEKALAAHCGGWDEIDGGTCPHAWRLLLGCREVYTFKKTRDNRWCCYGTYDSVGKKWAQLANSPHKGFQGLWPMAWPEVGGGGDADLKVDNDEFFERMCHWDDADFILAAGSAPGSDKDTVKGIVQGHAYTILQCANDVAGTDKDLIQVRNPWGHGEYTAGKWIDDGSGWNEYPQIKSALKPTVEDNGVFWMQDCEFFRHFETVYLCAKDMSKATFS